MRTSKLFLIGIAVFGLHGCSSDDSTTTTTSTIPCTSNVTASTTTNSNGCALVTRDVSSCQSSRESQGLSGYWLKFSCNVTLTKSGDTVAITADNQPDYKSYYYGSSHTCYQDFSVTGRNPNMNTLAETSTVMTVDYTPAAASSASETGLGMIGIALNGTFIFNNSAAPGDSIYDEVSTFDQCDGHPAGTDYHNHIEPPSISQTDSNFIGIMKDGFPVYGRQDSDGSEPTLDSSGGHEGPLPDDANTTLYHYHVHQQTGTDSNGDAASAYFISAGFYYGTPTTSCSGCGGQM